VCSQYWLPMHRVCRSVGVVVGKATVVLAPLPVPVELREALDRKAREHFRSRADEIRWVLTRHVQGAVGGVNSEHVSE
jgi:hypothetical protein